MIYLDTSVALAQLLAEDRRPVSSFWEQPLISSRLIQYEVWTRLHVRNLEASHGEAARLLIGRLALVELAPPILERALEPFPLSLRTLDALHLASMDYLRSNGQRMQLASFDLRMNQVAEAIGFPLSDV